MVIVAIRKLLHYVTMDLPFHQLFMRYEFTRLNSTQFDIMGNKMLIKLEFSSLHGNDHAMSPWWCMGWYIVHM